MKGTVPGMNAFKFNFKLRRLDKIAPFAQEIYRSLHWFGLTDGLFWIDIGEQTIYEYSPAANDFFGSCEKYNEYNIARFMEDFFHTFRYVGESIPEELYNRLDTFGAKAEQWRKRYDMQEDDIFELFFEDEYSMLSKWWLDRGFDSAYLIGGPDINCFRCGDKIKIMWESKFLTGSGESIWTAPKGCYEMPYEDFISSITDFFHSFFEAMEQQIDWAVKREWGSIEIDEKALREENEKRKSDLLKKLTLLRYTDEYTNWDKIMKLYEKMEHELADNPVTGV